MAIYPYKCSACGREEEIIQSISSYSKAPIRPQCHGEMTRVFTVPMVSQDIEPFRSTIDGTVINSRSSRREHMLKHGVVLHADIESEIPKVRQEMARAELEDRKKAVVEAVHKTEAGYKPVLETAEA